MFDVGFTEILLIGIVALIVIGPERLPAVAKTTGQWVGKLQRFVKGVKTDLASELETGDLKKLIGDQREQINELRDMVSSTQKDLQSTASSVVKTTKESLGELENTINSAKSDDPSQTTATTVSNVESVASDTEPKAEPIATQQSETKKLHDVPTTAASQGAQENKTGTDKS